MDGGTGGFSSKNKVLLRRETAVRMKGRKPAEKTGGNTANNDN